MISSRISSAIFTISSDVFIKITSSGRDRKIHGSTSAVSLSDDDRACDLIRRRIVKERELTALFGVKVALELWVRVEPGWMKNKRLLADMGYLGGLV